MKVNQAIKYRLYPTIKQEEILWRTISNTRKMYNMMLGDYWKQLDFAKQCEERGEERPKCGVRYATYFKKENEFFCETDAMAYSNAWQTVQKSLKSYFSRPEVGKPKFKSYYNDKWSYTTNNIHRNTITVENNRIRIPKVGFVKIRLHTPFPENSTFSSMTIEKTRSGHWYVSICFQYEKDYPVFELNPEKSVGLDYSATNLYVDNRGNSPMNPKFYKQNEEKLANAERKLSTCQKGSNNRNKARIRVAKVSEDIANKRKDFLWKLAHSIATNDEIHYVFVEDLDLKKMSKRRKELKLGKSTTDNSWGKFLLMLDMKLKENGKQLVKIDRYFPSSQRCSVCGELNSETKDLSIREWVCPHCGTKHDRDVNAAINIRNEGIRMIKEQNI